MDTFAALAVPTRRSIVEMLARKGRLSATDISTRFNATPSAISQHLKVLREADVVRVRRKAQWRLYELNPEALARLETWARHAREGWKERFDALDELLQKDAHGS